MVGISGPLVEIGLADQPKSGGAPPDTTPLESKYMYLVQIILCCYICLDLVREKFFKFANW